jgi:hypothetical protein
MALETRNPKPETAVKPPAIVLMVFRKLRLNYPAAVHEVQLPHSPDQLTTENWRL